MHNIKNSLEQKLHINREQIISFCNIHQHIYIYGTGNAAREIFRYLQEENIEVASFIVSDGRKSSETFYDIKVMEISEVEMSLNDGILLGVGKEHISEIVTELKRRGINNIFIQNIYYMNTTKEMKIDQSVMLEKDNSSGIFFEAYHELDDIGKKCSTDKCSLDHNYLKKYEFFLNKFRDCKMNVLELGVLRGSSVQTWSQYFSNAKIYGIDIDKECLKYAGKNIEIQIKDLSKMCEIEKLKQIKPTIIIDDASHMWSHQIKALCVLFSSLEHGGIYIMEDLETSFQSYSHMNYNDAIVSGYDFCEMLAEVTTSKERLRGNRSKQFMQFEGEIESIARQLDIISFIKGSCIMVKK